MCVARWKAFAFAISYSTQRMCHGRVCCAYLMFEPCEQLSQAGLHLSTSPLLLPPLSSPLLLLLCLHRVLCCFYSTHSRVHSSRVCLLYPAFSSTLCHSNHRVQLDTADCSHRALHHICRPFKFKLKKKKKHDQN